MIVFGAMEAALTPLMEAVEAGFAGVKVFSLPSVDHPSGAATSSSASRASRSGSTKPTRRCWRACASQGAKLGPELVR